MEAYDHVMKLSGSDHKPVFAVMTVRVKDYDDAKLKKTRLRVERELKRTENATAPVNVSLSTNTIDFGSLKYKTAETQSLEIRNDGEGNAYFHFLPKAEDPHVSKRMFTVSPAYGVVIPGETVTVKTTGPIDGRSSFTGELLGFEDGCVFVAADGADTFRIPYDNIKKARVKGTIDFSA